MASTASLSRVDDVEDAGRQPGVHHQLGDAQRHTRITLRGLQDESVAASDGGGELPQRDHGRKVERCDAGHHAERLAQGIDVDAGSGALGVLALHEVRDAAGELDDLKAALHFRPGFGQRLAVLARDQSGEFFEMLLQKCAKAKHQPGPFDDGRFAPGLQRRGGGQDHLPRLLG